jgi:hypothetical protein
VKLRGTVFLVTALLVIPSVLAQDLPDVYIDEVNLLPADAIYTGDQVRVTVTVGSAGATVQNVDVALFVDNRSHAVDETTVAQIADGEVQTVTLYWLAEEGEHRIFVFVDYTGEIEEDNEDNNLMSLDVTVEKPIYPPFPPSAYNATWWDTAWHYRVPVTTSMLGEREDVAYADKMVYATVEFTALMDNISRQQAGSFSRRTFYPDSVRVVEYGLDEDNATWQWKRSVGRELIFSDDYDPRDKANVTVMWVMEGDVAPHERRYYYIYWDTVENGDKRGEFARIKQGVKNAEFEDATSSQWTNVTEGAVQWQLGYAEDPVEGDSCYRMYARGLYGSGYIWSPGYAQIRQNIDVPDGGESWCILNARLFADSDVTDFTWEVRIDGVTVDTGTSTGGWTDIRKNITSYVSGKTSASISFRAEVTASSVATEPQEIGVYVDACWIQTPTVAIDLFDTAVGGWWGNISGLSDAYIKGVDGRKKIDEITVTSIAEPKEVVAKLYSPDSQLKRVSMPLPDPSFEEDVTYTYLFANDVQTTRAQIQNAVVYEGSKTVELRLQNYEGTWQFQNEEVTEGDLAGFRQNITYGISLAQLPDLFFWYNLERSSSTAVLNYTLLTVGASPKFFTVPLADLSADGTWHQFHIPESTVNRWKQSGGSVTAIEVRLIATGAGAESAVYLDNLGYSFMPANANDRTQWTLHDFYTFESGAKTGTWRIDVILTDGSDYRIEKSSPITVDEAADLNIYQVTVPSGLQEGETGTFTVYVKNEGKKAVPEETPINISLSVYQQDGEYIKMRKSIAGLGIGESTSVDFTWDATYGNPSRQGVWNVVARVNENGNILESDTIDNWYPTTVTVIPRPDLALALADVLFDPGNPDANEPVNISVIVHNNGYANATALVRILKKGPDDNRFTLITDGSIDRFVERRDKIKITHTWAAGNGTYHIKIDVRCLDEINTKNNVVVKDLRVGGGPDTDDPRIESIRITPPVVSMGGSVNVSATVFDNTSTIDLAFVTLSNETGETTHYMNRVGTTDIYYANITLNAIGYYDVVVSATDTAALSHQTDSKRMVLRVIYEGIDAEPPVIRAISINPPDGVQAFGSVINISAYVGDAESDIARAELVITKGESSETHEMTEGKNSIYYYRKTAEAFGTFTYHIKATDGSANKNRDRSANFTFVVPVDFDRDDVPDNVEVDAGSDPKNASDAINVSTGTHRGFLLKMRNASTYVYWSAETNETRDVTERDENGDGIVDILFDADGDGTADYVYDIVGRTLTVYETDEEDREKTETVWLLPPLALFVLVCIGFVIVRKK